MKVILFLISAFVYIVVFLFLAVVILIPGIGVWSDRQTTGFAFDIPPSVKVICLVLLISPLAGGLYYLSNVFRSA